MIRHYAAKAHVRGKALCKRLGVGLGGEAVVEGGGQHEADACDSIKSASVTLPPVAAAILTAKGSEGCRWPYTILRTVFSGSLISSANAETVFSTAFK